MAELRIEIEAIASDVINGSILIGDSGNAGTIQFRKEKSGYRAIKRLRKLGVPVIFPNYLKIKPGKKH